jgi:hypothetical protein
LIWVEGGGVVKRFVIWLGAGTLEIETVVEGYMITRQGLQKLEVRGASFLWEQTPRYVVPAAIAIASGNPIGLIVLGGMKIYGERQEYCSMSRATASRCAQALAAF